MLDEEEGGVGVLMLSLASTFSELRGIRPAAEKPLSILALENAWPWIFV